MEDPVDDRRLLLEFLLSQLRDKVQLPPGAPSFGSKHLDYTAISARAVLRAAVHGTEIDLSHIPLLAPPAAPAAPPADRRPLPDPTAPPAEEVGDGGVAVASLEDLEAAETAAAGAAEERAEEEKGAEEEEEEDDDEDGFLGARLREELPLDDDETVLVAVETLILASPLLTYGEMSEADTEGLRSLRVQLGVGSRTFSRLTEQLRVQGLEGAQLNAHAYLHYRLIAVRARRPSDFEAYDDFLVWLRRQLIVYGYGLLWAIRQTLGDGADDSSSVLFAGESVTFADVFATVRDKLREVLDMAAKFSAADEFRTYCEAPYTALLDEVDDLLALLPEAVAERTRLVAYPHPLSTELYTVLLRALFDQDDVTEMAFNHEQLIETLGHVRRALRISGAMAHLALIRCYFNVFAATGKESLLDVAMENVDAASTCASPDPLLAAVMDGDDASRIDAQFRAAVAREMVNFLEDRIGDFREHMGPNPESITTLVHCLNHVQATLLGMDDAQQEARTRELIQAGIGRHFERCLGERRSEAAEAYSTGPDDPLPTAILAQFCTQLVDEVGRDVTFSARAFRDLVPEVVSDMLSAYLDRLEPCVRASYAGASMIDEASAEVVGALLTMEQNLDEDALKERIFGLYDMFMPLIIAWVSHQTNKYTEVLQRTVFMETWDACAEPPNYANSLVDLFAMFDQTSPFIFRFNLPNCLGFLHAYADGIERVVLQYINMLMASLGSTDAFTPPLPPLSMQKTKYGGLVKKKEAQPYITPDHQSRLEKQTLERLLVRINTVSEVPRKLEHLQALMEANFDQMLETRADAGPTSMRELDLFNACYSIIEEKVAALCDYTGAKVVFFDMREPFLQGLFVPSVADAPLAGVTALFDDLFGRIMENVYFARAKAVMFGLLKHFCICLRRVLLDGGPDRIFDVRDAERIARDLMAAREVFIGRDDEGNVHGIEDAIVDRLVGPLTQLLVIMELDTSGLIEAFETSESNETRDPTSRHNVLRMLNHRRNDADAKKYVHAYKKQNKTLR